MKAAYIIDAVRSPRGKGKPGKGALSGIHPQELLAQALQQITTRTGISPSEVEDVVAGCVSQAGDQGANVARNAVLTAGWPETVPGTTVDRQCGSGQQAIHFAAQGVMAGVYDAVVAGGVEVMSKVPLGASIIKGMDFPFPPAMLDRYQETGLPPQGIGAEMIADQWGLSRGDLDAFGAASQQRAAQATAEGRFEREIVPFPLPRKTTSNLWSPMKGFAPRQRWNPSPRSSPHSRKTARSPQATPRRSPMVRRRC